MYYIGGDGREGGGRREEGGGRREGGRGGGKEEGGRFQLAAHMISMALESVLAQKETEKERERERQHVKPVYYLPYTPRVQFNAPYFQHYRVTLQKENN